MAAGKRQGDLLSQLSADLQKTRRPYYLFLSEIPWFITEAVALLRRRLVPAEQDAFAFVARSLDTHSDWAEVEALLRSYSFFGEGKLIHLEVPGKLGAENREAMARYLAETPGQNTLCISAPNLDQLIAAKNRIAKHGGLILAFSPIPREALPGWIKEYLRSHGLSFETPVPELLAECLPPDPGEIAGEIEKLCLALGEGEKIRVQDVKRLIGQQKLDDIWQLTAALRPGREAEAMRRLQSLLESGGQDPQRLIGALAYTVATLLRARLLLDEGRSPAAAADAMPIRGRIGRDYVDRAAELNKGKLLVWLGNLQKLDSKLKRTHAEPDRLLLEAALLESLAGRHLRGAS